MSRAFRIMDVFTDRPLAGNQLAVILDAEGLDDHSMQAIAREFGFSETTFVMPATVAGCEHRVRIFTPARELPVAGHPIIGTTVLLHSEGLIDKSSTLQLGVGSTPVRVDDGGRAWMTFPTGEFGALMEDGSALALALSVDGRMFQSGLRPQVVSCGNEFLLVPLVSADAVAACRPDAAAWSAVTDVSPAGAVYCFALGQQGRVRARMFWPTVGMMEDAATGSAAAPLGVYCHRYLRVSTLQIEQGVEMSRPSLIHVESGADGGPLVGGAAVVVASGELHA